MGAFINAKKGEVAETVLLPGDPLRAKVVAETFLKNPKCYNVEKGMLGFTGEYKGKLVSVQGTGMGVPSATLCVRELVKDYGAKNLIRIGTCGSIRADIPVYSVLVAQAASSSCNINNLVGIPNVNFAPTADFGLVRKSVEAAKSLGIDCKVGTVITAELFHNPDGFTNKFAEWGHMAIEMEAAGIYIEAAKLGVRALSILTVSDSLVTFELTTAEQRQNSFTEMMRVALETAHMI